MHDPSCGDFHYNEDVDDRKQSRILRQEVIGIDLLCVILYKRFPCLTNSRFSSSHHLFADRTGRMLHSKFDGQFLCDLVLAPLGMVGTDATNQLYVFLRN